MPLSAARLVDEIERNTALDHFLDRAQDALTPAVDRLRLSDLLSGRAIGHPAHPPLVMMPIGCWIGAVALDLTSLHPRTAARRLMGIGVATSLPAIASGLVEWVHTRDAERRIGAVHAALNAVATGLFATSWVRRRGESPSGRIVALSGMSLVGLGGWLGGHLAYRRGVGVNTAAFQSLPNTWTRIAQHDSIEAGTLTAACLDGVSVLLTEGEGTSQVLAMESRCTHRGGPLHEGSLEDGCVRCPWHGSLFDLETGAVRRGPASIPQRVPLVRVSGDHVEIRSDDPAGIPRKAR